MKKKIYILGLLDWQREELETIEKADEYDFVSLLTHHELVEEHAGFDELLDRCRRQFEAEGKPDAIVCHWDFPSSCLAPVLGREYGVRAPTLESVLKCEHKYWARIMQQEAVPECTPDFQALDPFDDDAASKLRMDFPVWLKPVKGFSSMLGFMVNDREELKRALAEMREHIGDVGKPFEECLHHADLPQEVREVSGTHALAEEVMSGIQFAPEGYVQDGKVHIHGMFDMLLDQGGKDVLGLRYPADLPQSLHDRANDAARRIIEHVGFDDGCFNVEFLYDEAKDKLWLIEVNTRISQSHCELFRKVDGMSNHEIAVKVALGREPHFPHDQGPNRLAAKLSLEKVGDAEVTRVPEEAELERLGREHDAIIQIGVKPGDRLSKLPHQPPYAYHIGDVFIGAESKEQLMERYREIARRAAVEFSDGEGLRA